MLDKVPADRRIHLLAAAGIGFGAGYYFHGPHDPVQAGFVGLAVAVVIIMVVLNAVAGGDLVSLLNATRGAR